MRVESGELKAENHSERSKEFRRSDEIAFYKNITWQEKFVAFGTRFPPLRSRSGPPEVGLPCGMAPIGRRWENPEFKWKNTKTCNQSQF